MQSGRDIKKNRYVLHSMMHNAMQMLASNPDSSFEHVPDRSTPDITERKLWELDGKQRARSNSSKLYARYEKIESEVEK